jgi:hypothetical protein
MWNNVYREAKDSPPFNRNQGLIPWLQEHLTGLYAEKNEICYCEHLFQNYLPIYHEILRVGYSSQFFRPTVRIVISPHSCRVTDPVHLTYIDDAKISSVENLHVMKFLM